MAAAAFHTKIVEMGMLHSSSDAEGLDWENNFGGTDVFIDDTTRWPRIWSRWFGQPQVSSPNPAREISPRKRG